MTGRLGAAVASAEALRCLVVITAAAGGLCRGERRAGIADGAGIEPGGTGRHDRCLLSEGRRNGKGDLQMSNVRIAMIGSGFVAEFYMQGLANVRGQEGGANYSRDLKRAREFAMRWTIPEPGTDLGQIIEREDIDLYVIALPNEEHLPVSLALSKAKKHQVCTKPLARNHQEAKAMWKAADESGKMHAYAETEVFSPCVVKAREMAVERLAKVALNPPLSRGRAERKPIQSQ